MKLGLAIAFFVTALLYSSVGFGGGSTYTALLAVSGLSFTLVPVISLSCNIAVVSGTTFRFSRAGLVRGAKLLPLVALSIPMAWWGGRMVVSETLFIGLLWIALLFAGLRLLFAHPPQDGNTRKTPAGISVLIGGAVGFYSGIVGIGGGIFLAPILHGLRWGQAKEIAAASSVFILVNSIAGLSGQLSKLENIDEAVSYWPLIIAVLVGGWIGNKLTLLKLSPALLRRLTGGLILVVAVRLAIRWIGLVS